MSKSRQQKVKSFEAKELVSTRRANANNIIANARDSSSARAALVEAIDEKVGC